MASDKEVNNLGADKVSVYRWMMQILGKFCDEPGEFRWIHKDKLNIDHDYQRDRVSQARIRAIRNNWSWVACGVLVVASRGKEGLWVVDGQHRKLAVESRSDINELPCIVFNTSGVKEEASGFYRANTARGPMDSCSKYKSLIVSGDPVAISVDKMIRESGYKVHYKGGRWKVRCVQRILNCYNSDPQITSDIWALIVDICEGAGPKQRVVAGLFFLEARLRRLGQTLLTKQNISQLKKAGMDAINESIEKTLAYYGKGGEKYFAEGIVRLLNHRRSAHRIPSMFS